MMALAFITLPACSGGGSSSSEPAVPVPQGLLISVDLPRADKTLQYVSPSTKSATAKVTVDGQPAIVRTTDCDTSCVLNIAAPPGQADIELVLYDGLGGTGNELSKTNEQFLILAGKLNQFSLSLGGVISKIKVTVPTVDFIVGQPATELVGVQALDASGNKIIGLLPYTSPISVQVTGTQNAAFELSNLSIASPAGGSITLRYSGTSSTADDGLQLIASTQGDKINEAVSLHIKPESSIQPMHAESAASFIDSIGVNVHLHYDQTAYVNQYQKFRDALVQSGIRHVRDGVIDTTWQPFYDHLLDLGSAGIHATLIVRADQPNSLWTNYPTKIPGVIEAFEGPNELDHSNLSNWAATARSAQARLYSAIKSDSRTSSLSVIGPSLTSSDSYSQVGDISQSMDYGNMHNYFAGFQPGSAGWGGPGFGSHVGSIVYNIGAAAQTSKALPVITTETGFCTVPNLRNAVTPAVQAIYEPRMFLEQWLAGVKRTFQYEFIDEGSGCAGAYGLLNADATPKPAYYALKNFIHVLDVTNNNNIAGGSKDYPLAVTANTPSMHHVLLSSRDGSYRLVLWNETASWNVNDGNGTPAAVKPENVVCTFGVTPKNVSQIDFTADGSTNYTSPILTGDTITLPIRDTITVLSFTR